MKYSFTVAALVSMAAGSLAAGHGHANAHERLHAREAEAVAEAKPEPTEYSWSDGQCFGTYGCLSKTNAPAQASPPAGGDVQAQAAPAKPTKSATTLAQAPKPASSAQAPASSETGSSSSGGSSSAGSSNVLSSITSKGMKQPASSSNLVGTSSQGGSSTKCTVSNKSGKDLLYVCWGSAASWVNAQAPLIAQPISNGQSSTLYFAQTPGGQQGPGCTAVFADTPMSNGQIKNTWVEHTFSPDFPRVDVSREVTMSGTKISVQTGSGADSCTSDMTQCSFHCTNGQDVCGEAGTYAISAGSSKCDNSSVYNGGCPIAGKSMSITIG